ncbi:MAG: DUF4347 domain-containing protein, partial [Pseudomonadota bacterium]
MLFSADSGALFDSGAAEELEDDQERNAAWLKHLRVGEQYPAPADGTTVPAPDMQTPAPADTNPTAFNARSTPPADPPEQPPPVPAAQISPDIQQTGGQPIATDTGDTEIPPKRVAVLLAFFDTSLSAPDSLLSQVTPATGEFEWITIPLGTDTNGVLEITETLQGIADLSGIHVFGAQSGNSLQLGSAVINTGTLPDYAEQFDLWQEALIEHAPMVLHGCSDDPSPEDCRIIEQFSFAGEPATPVEVAADVPESPIELVFVDSATPDANQLLADLKANHTDAGRLKIVSIAADQAGIDVITDTLQHHHEVSAVHLIAHGGDGRILLGNEILDANTLEQHHSQIEIWRQALSHNADLLIYGCDVAATEHGENFLNALSEVSSADVAASDDRTGHQSLGADWTLEYTVGTVEAQLAISASAQHNWQHTLDITSGLVGHYAFEIGNTVTDSAGNQNLTVSSGNVGSNADAAVGDNSAWFVIDSGSNGYLEAADNAAQDFGSGDFTIAFWYNQTGNPATDARLLGDYAGAGTGFAVRATSTGNLEIDLEGASGSTSSAVTGTFDGTWQHVAITYNSASNTYLWHLNATAVSSHSYNGGSLDTANAFRMGAFDASGGDFDGQLDDVRLYTRELNTPDVAELYALGGDITSDLVAHYEFEDGTGTTAIDSVNAHDATLTGSPVFTSNGLVADAIDFSPDSGGTSLATIPNHADFDFGSDDFTIAFWFNTDNLALQSLISHRLGDGQTLSLTSGGQLQWVIDGTVALESVIISGLSADTWYHVTAIRSGNTFTLEADSGTATHTDSATTNVGSISTTTDITLGGSSDFDGRLDDLRLYKGRALSQLDVRALRSLGGDITSDLFAYYQFEENGGSTSIDSSGYNNNGTWINAPGWSTSSAVGSHSMDFDSDTGGSQAYVNVPDDASINIGGDFAFSFWYNTTTAPTGIEVLLSQHASGNGFFVYHTPSGDLA